MLKTAVALLLAAALALPAAALAQESPPEAPQGVEMRIRDGGPLITWLPVTGAETYEVRKALCDAAIRSDCTLAGTTETAWQVPADMLSEDGYLVAACNDSGCSKAVPADRKDDRPEAPEWVRVEQTPDGILVSWAPVDGAAEYQVIYDARLSRSCHLRWPEQELLQCHEAGRTTDTQFLHQDAEPLRARYYWVAACNQAGCRKIRGKGAQVGEAAGQPTQEPEAATPQPVGDVAADLTLNRTKIREGENFDATLTGQVRSDGAGTLILRLYADGDLHLTGVTDQESCGPGCVSISHETDGDEHRSLIADFTAGQRGTALLRGEVEWKPDAPGATIYDSDEKAVIILAGQDSPNPVIQSSGPEPVSTPPPTVAPVPIAPPSSGGGCGSSPVSGGPGSLALLGLLILPVAGLVRRPLLAGTGLFRERP